MLVTVIVLDSVGVGALPDASEFGDAGSHTLNHIVERTGVALPNLMHLGLGRIESIEHLPRVSSPEAAYGRMREASPGKDTTTGHWEFMGAPLEKPFKTFARFPDEVMAAFDAATGRPHLGNVAASGTVILEQLGEQHLATGAPIVYTSADSVFQVAAHVDVVPLEQLYAWCETARDLLQGDHAVARVIARPFLGAPGAFERLHGKRRDYSVSPPHTVLDALSAAGVPVRAVGKINDIYNGKGISESHKTGSNAEGVDTTLDLMNENESGLIFCNLVDFDAIYGHRRDVGGYAQALSDFDQRLPDLLLARRPEDVLMLVSDHGNDPTWPGTDHTREHGLLLAVGPQAAGRDLGTRQSFSDLGATVAALLGVAWTGPGSSFAHDLVMPE